MKKTLVLLAVFMIAAGSISAQSTPDPAMQEAKAKLEVVYDLGRIFGFIQRMDKEEKKLALSSAQAKSLVGFAEKIKAMSRIEPQAAEAMLTEIEDKVLKADQLMYVDGLAIETQSTRSAPTGAGSASGTSPVQSYMNGGPFNPMQDTSKKIGQDFKAAYEYLKAKK